MGIKNKINSFRKARANVVYNRFAKNLNDFAVDDTWNSSAQNLENKIKQAGFILPQKLYYEYKFPDNLKNYEVDKQTLFARCFIAIYENYLEQFNGTGTKKKLFYDAAETARNDLSGFFGFCICLALSNIKNLKSVFDKTYNDCIKQIHQLAQEIHELNPELQNIKNYKDIDFVNGAIYGFAPPEIDFFMQNNLIDSNGEQYPIENMEKIAQLLNMERVTYVLSPDTAEQVLQSIQRQKKLHTVNQDTGTEY